MGDCSNEKIPRENAASGHVSDVMVARPKTLPVAATVGDLHRLFENPHVATALLVDGTRFAGAVDRETLPEDAPDEAPATAYVREEPATTTPDAPMQEAMALMDENATRRLVVLADDGATLSGLLCLTANRTGFCV